MAVFGAGLVVLYVLLGVVVFVVAVLILRWVFGIGKIVNLLGVIAQELRAANAANDVDLRLRAKGMDEKLGKYLNRFELREYRVTKIPQKSEGTPPATPEAGGSGEAPKSSL